MGGHPMDHPLREHLAEILVTRPSRKPSRGTGYRVDPRWVLTAAHVLDGADSVRVWFNAPAELRPDEGVGVDPAGVLVARAQDLALVPVPLAQTARMEPVMFGALTPDSPVAVPVVAAGFPRFKLRPAPDRSGVLLRDVTYAVGSIVAGANAKTGTLAFTLSTGIPGEDPGPDGSPWEGMSGAAVWASGRLVGVVGQHYPGEGTGTLTLRPFAGLLDDAARVHQWRQNALPRLPERLEEVTPPTARELVSRRAQRVARALAPDVLISRESARAALEEFSDSDGSWRWIQGDTFAGKSALLAWFALHPPPGVDIVACFLRRTVSGENTVEYALSVLADQLAALAGRPGHRPPQYVSAAAGELLDELLPAAARACQERDHRLLVLVDGLDEYETGTAAYALASWLPDQHSLPPGAALLVASRAGVSIDLDVDHPLYRQRHRLAASEAATEIRRLAGREIRHALGEPGRLEYSIVGFLAAADGGLTSAELHALLKFSGRTALDAEIKTTLRTTLDRTIQPAPDPDGLADQVHVFSHDALRTEARDQFAADLPVFESHLYAWADQYAALQWPVDTPRYLLLPYPRLLIARALEPANSTELYQQLIDRLFTLGMDSRWLRRALERTGNPAVPDYQIVAIQRILLESKNRSGLDRDEFAYRLAALALSRRPVTGEQSPVAATVARVWAVLGRIQPALALSAGIDDPRWRSDALIGVAGVLAQAGQTEQAGQAAEQALAAAGLDDPWARGQQLADVVTVLAQAGRTEQALDVAAGIDDREPLAKALARIAIVLAQAGHTEQAKQMAEQAFDVVAGIDDPWFGRPALPSIAMALAQVGQTKRALDVVAGIDHPASRAWMLADVAGALGQAGRTEQARQVAEQALEVAAGVDDPELRAEALADAAGALAQAGRTEQAGQVAEQALDVAAGVDDPGPRASALAGVATLLAQGGRTEQAGQAAEQALDVDAGGDHPWSLSRALPSVAAALARVGRIDQALDVVAGIDDPEPRAEALAGVATALAQAGRTEQAGQVAEQAPSATTGINKPHPRPQRLEGVAATLAQAGRIDQARDAAGGIDDPGSRAEALAGVATALAQAGHTEQAGQVAEQALGVAASIDDSLPRAWALAEVAGALAQVGRPEQARQVAEQALDVAAGLNDHQSRAAAAAAVVATVGSAEAVELLLTTSHVRDHLQTLPVQLLSRLVREGHLP
jgi:tetratricopeptide (TPR) repeat protein